MYFVKNVYLEGKPIYDPAINLAIEYHLLNHVVLDEPILLFYINDDSIIIGKNQNAYDEINLDYVEANKVKVVRRMSGGGAVYHDLGVLNFCFITKDDGDSFGNFKRFTQPIIEALHEMGAEGAKLEGRNDLVINGQKFSGNAMYTTKGRMTAHGTLMFDSQINALVDALKPNRYKLESRGIKSVRSRVTNIKPFLKDEYQTMTTREIQERLLVYLFDVEDLDQIKLYKLTDEDWASIQAFAEKYTNNWDWNYGKSPDFEIQRSQRFEGVGTVDVKFNVANGRMENFSIYGDFFGKGDISDVEACLEGQPYAAASIRQALDQVDIDHYIGPVSQDDLAALIY